MTEYEIQQIGDYLDEIVHSLDEWTLRGRL